jgi:hypothetical protein
MADDGLAARVDAERRTQGLSGAVTDSETLRQVAGLLGAQDQAARERRLAEVERDLAEVEFEVRFRLGDELS